MGNQQVNRTRGYTISLNDEKRVADLESEMDKVKQENTQLATANEDLKAQVFRNNMESGRILLHMTASNGPSLAAEMDTMSKDDLLEKFKDEQNQCKRLRDYVESILEKIMIHCPEVLEIITS